MFPCLWIGLINHRTPKDYNEAALKPGQFLFEHQYEGTSCKQVSLFGAVFPLSTCTDLDIFKGFCKLEKRYYDMPFHGWSPNLDDLIQVREDLKGIGPLDCTNDFEYLGEAFLTFDPSDELFLWIKKHFKMATAIEDHDDYKLIEVTEEKEVEFSSSNEFVKWLKLPDERLFSLWLKAAFIYENSD